MSQKSQSDLDWPHEFERTPAKEREEYSGGFQVTRSTAFQNVLDELRGWDGVTDVQLDSGAEHQSRNPNKPYANASFDDPGVVVRFQKDGQDMAAACDQWDNPRDNAQDLYYFLRETRLQELRGTVTAESEYEKLRLPSGNEAEAAEPPPHKVLGVTKDAGDDEVREAFRDRIKETHADQGGSSDAAKRVIRAKEKLLS